MLVKVRAQPHAVENARPPLSIPTLALDMFLFETICQRPSPPENQSLVGYTDNGSGSKFSGQRPLKLGASDGVRRELPRFNRPDGIRGNRLRYALCDL
jgi:hypothetical protein